MANVIGTEGFDFLSGTKGDDDISGLAGDDVIFGSEGNDVIDGGADRDSVFFTISDGNLFTAPTGARTYYITGDSVSDSSGLLNSSLTSIEFIGFSNQYAGDYSDTIDVSGWSPAPSSDASTFIALGDGNNTVLGSGGIDFVYAGSGNDTLNGRDGNDSLHGGDGNDQLIGGAGDDLLDGGDGRDLVDYGAASGPVVVNLGAGTATGEGNDTLIGIEDVLGSTYDDNLTGDGDYNVLNGGGGNDTLHGAGGDDTLIGGAGDDRLYGDDGNDQLVGSIGDDLLDGGDGQDIADYGAAAGSVVVDLGAGTASGADGNDTLVNIEWIQGSGYNDSLTGDAGYNFIDGGGGDDVIYGAGGDDGLFGGGGNDQIHGGDGNDQLAGSTGDDLLDGGDGQDIADYGSAAGSVVVDLGAGTASGADGNDTLVSVEWIQGSAYDDQLTGDGGYNFINGGGGNDTIYGAGGDDTLFGGDGNDALYGGDGNDQLVGQAGDDLLDGGAGRDVADYQYAFGAVTVDLSTGTASGADGNDTLVGIEDIKGSAFDDTLTGDAGDNFIDAFDGNDVVAAGAGNDYVLGGFGNDTIDGGAGYDTLDGGDGNDTLDGGAGNDQLYGGAGNDTATFASETGGVTAQLYNGGFGEAWAADGYDQLHDIENLTGSSFGDTLIGNGIANVLSGGDGNDVLSGGGGNDTLDGGDGNDSLAGGGGNDTLQGGSGNDFLNGGFGNDTIDGGDGFDRIGYFGGATSGVTVDLRLQGVAQNVGEQGFDTLTNIEGVSGTIFADTLTGDDNDNWLWGSFSGGGTANNDTLDGQGGNDLLSVGIGNHSLTGGSGIDTVAFSENGGAEPNLTVSLALQGAAQVTGAGNWTLNGVENLSGGVGNDALTGDGGNNVLAGYTGNDSLVGGAGNDVLYGDGVILADTRPTGGSGPITTFADATLWDPTAIDGNDTLDGGAGDDQLYGGGGVDTASYASETGAVQAYLYNSGFGEAFAADGYDQLHDIENLTGSAFNDLLVGNSIANVLIGGDGNDGLYGGGGDDSLQAGSGNDFINGGFGNDTIDGGDGFDRIGYFNGATSGVTVDLRLQGVAQNVGQQGFDTLTSIEGVSGTIFADTLTGDGNDNWLWGSGSGGGTTNNDTLDGQGGNDLLSVGIGNHNLTGGSGIDTVAFTENGGAEPNLTVSLVLQGAAQVTGAGNWTLNGVENLSGGVGNDTLTGDGGNNVLAGYTGNDTLVGGAGNDILYGDGLIIADTRPTGGSGPITTFTDATLWDPGAVDGNDLLEGGLGDDTIDGGGGIDTASYANASGSVVVGLFNNTSGNGTASGADGNDTLVSIENVTGSAYNDNITGNAAANVIYGNDGNDFLQARGGDDIVFGGAGNDYLGGGTGNDYLDGGEGWDRASFSNGATAAVHVDLRIVGAQDTGLGIDTLVNIENVSATGFSDTLIGNDGANWLWGGTDSINFGDTIDGQGGDDLIEDGVGNHVLTGGSGIDTFLFNPFTAPTNATISLALQGSAQDTGAGIMTLTGFENLSGGQYADTLIGDANANVLAGSEGADTLVGGAGNDTLYGDGYIGTSDSPSGPIATFADVSAQGGIDGNDTLEGGLGDDMLNGGGGSDTASYARASGGVNVNLGSGFASGADGNDTLVSIENVIGSGFEDTLTGNEQANQIEGGDGADFVRAGGGNDLIYGGNGNDILKGQDGDDLIDGGAGIDRAGYYQADATLGGVTVSLLLQGTAQNVGSQGWDTLVGIENVFGTPFADRLTGDDGNNWLSGSEATIGVGNVSASNNDVLDGQGGNDLLSVGIGNQTIIGGTGNDTLWFSENGFPESGIAVSLALQGAAQATGNGSWTLTGIENLTGGVANDTLTGDGNVNVLGGGAGSDTLVGGAGDDVLYGDGGIAINGNDVITTFTDVATIVAGGIGSDVAMMPGVDGNDLLEGGLGNDTINGGGGIDTASYARASGSVTVNLTTGTSSGADGNDTITNVENLIGSAFNDTLSGNGLANTLDGGAGGDTLQGGAGNDVLIGGAGADVLDGGAGVDTADYSGSTAGVSVNLQNGRGSGGAANGDTLSNIENVVGSGFNDTLVGTSAANMLNGGAGNDTLNGGGGADTLYGGLGSDIFVFKSSAEIGTGASHDVLMDFDAGGSGSGTRVDYIDLTAIDAIARTATRDDAFTFLGTSAFTNRAGELRIEITGDGTANILGDTNGDGIADFVLEVHYTGTLDASDFGL